MLNEYKKAILFYILAILFLAVPFSFMENTGGLGLNVPFNIVSWFIVTLFISITTLFVSREKTIVIEKAFIICLSFPVLIVLVGLLSEPLQPIVWVFRQLFIIGGCLFLFTLFQAKFKQFQIENILLIIVWTCLLHSLISFLQIWQWQEIIGYFPFSASGRPISTFQQPNLLASYLVTGLTIIIFLISRPSFLRASFFKKLFFIFVFSVGLYVILMTGSRVGLLSLILAIPMIVWSRKRYLSRQKRVVIGLAVSSLLVIFFSQSGLERVADKTQKMTEGEYSSVRGTMYAIGGELIKSNFLLGYGIGSFPKVWAIQTAKFSQKNPQAEIPQLTTTHPHNEALLWLIEAGVISILVLLLVFTVILVSIIKCGWSRGGAYAAILLPISLHTQVELPFYISAIHWFLWLFILFLLLRHHSYQINLNLSNILRYSIIIAAMFTFTITSFFLYHAKQAQKLITHYQFYGNVDITPALDNIYFSAYSEKIVMQNLLYKSIKINDKSPIPNFINWAEERLAVNPEMGMFIMLSDAYQFIGDREKQCMIATNGLLVYNRNKRLIHSREKACV